MKEEAVKQIGKNRKARFNYQILDTWEAGIQLVGSEVKSLRVGKVDFRDAYASFDGNELYLVGLHIAEYVYANRFNHEPTRKRKLLMHRRELDRLKTKLHDQGLTLIPTRLYFKNGRAKVELGLAKGKRFYDKREAMKERDAKRDMDRARAQRDR